MRYMEPFYVSFPHCFFPLKNKKKVLGKAAKLFCCEALKCDVDYKPPRLWHRGETVMTELPVFGSISSEVKHYRLSDQQQFGIIKILSGVGLHSV